ncbi:hypothetical protein BJ742DRAFT_285240 [Cladochytrium replicatum]|nr:hypothetical protein BJ742DRAFT_285240 [Cladochytrium replicatum]
MSEAEAELRASVERAAKILEDLVRDNKDVLEPDVRLDMKIGEIATLIALEKGEAFKVNVHRQTLPPIAIVVRTTWTLRHLRRAIAVQFTRKNPSLNIRWNHFWRSHVLAVDGQRMDQPPTGHNQEALSKPFRLSNYGAGPGSVLTFVKVLARRKRRSRAAKKQEFRETACE